MQINLKHSITGVVITGLLFSIQVFLTQAYGDDSNTDSSHSNVDTEIAQVFESRDIAATLLVSSSDGAEQHVYNASRANKRFSPASTFKVLNTLVALQLGIVKSAESPFKWDGSKHSVPSWNRDQTLDSAFRISCVWCYQKIAREVGLERYREVLENHDYGNKHTSDQVDLFWLNGKIKISAVEQVQILRDIADYSIGFKREHIDILKTIMLVEQTSDYSLYAKTGWTGPERHIGWYVGFVEKNQKRWLFAMNMDMHSAAQSNLRKQLTIEALQALGII